MRRESAAAVSAVFLALLSQHSLGFHIPAASPSAAHASPARSLQHSLSNAPASSSTASSRHTHQRLLLTRPLQSPLAAEADDGGSGGGFSSGAAGGGGNNKVSRKAAKKAKARGRAGPTVELKKQAVEGEPQQVSKSVVAEVLGAQAAKDGAPTADQVSAR